MPEEISFPKEQSTIPDELRSPIKHHVLLLRIDREQGIWGFYSPMIERISTDSSSRRNTYSVALPQPLVKHLGRGSPAQRLSRP
jgi:hypothetical protein